MDKVEILGIVGSLRKGCCNRSAPIAARKLVPQGTVVNLLELHDLPVFNQDDEMTPPAFVLEFKRRIQAANAILFATPQYSYSLPGALKKAIDWASRHYGESVWIRTPAALMGASGGTLGTVRAQYHLRQILVAQDMPVVNLPEVMIANAAKRFDVNGELPDEPTQKRVHKLLIALVQLTRQTRSARAERAATSP